jgi:polysaccharide pyruvyl transferase WcaK-like protein
MKILIPNATGPDNMGDQAILNGLLVCLDEAFPGHELTILSSSPQKYTGVKASRIDYNLYMWSVFQNANFFRVYGECYR